MEHAGGSGLLGGLETLPVWSAMGARARGCLPGKSEEGAADPCV